MRVVSLVALAVLLCSCDARVVTHKEYKEDTIVNRSCIYYGYCMGTKLDNEGNLTSGFRAGYCSGTEQIKAGVYEVEWHYESTPDDVRFDWVNEPYGEPTTQCR